MLQVGNRVYYNKASRNILFIAGEIHNADTQRDPDEVIEFIDIPFGSIDYSKNMIVGVDVENKKVILQPIENAQEKQIRELEDALLLATENDAGGIL
ncbi:hypothetical protein BFZC1_08830 [Lysinibacillus fusiformis ZC1]|uniref:hypothetical protein n=1 Tax=Lysinibacillus capsici TaxID=2115968 RepID=UPI0001DA57F4|nr:hypothetical protein [Lysinibacillus capsici]EFI68947.1 hypothetical protein BFZC1_08830 [Lysinibacillus fusiformis ZC1]EKU42491.1 hypothetical protein C518_2633 [Lysinibacillus fusiformis ZB2]MBU5253963.1 hypothetical protein [Lysinibacillus capsici]